MLTDLQNARSAIAREIGPDVAEFTPTSEKNFVGEVALLAFGSSFLYAFFKGVIEKAAEGSGKHLGEVVGTQLNEFFTSLFSKFHHAKAPISDNELETARKQASDALKTSGLSPAQVEAITIAVQQALASHLATDADRHVSERVAQRVRTEAVKTMGAA